MVDHHHLACPRCGGAVELMGIVNGWLDIMCRRCRIEIRIREAA